MGVTKYATQRLKSISDFFFDQVRIYYLGSGNILHEKAYSAVGENKGWNTGDLHKLGIVLGANAALVAIRLELLDNIHIYYQGWSHAFLQLNDAKLRIASRPQIGLYPNTLSFPSRALD